MDHPFKTSAFFRGGRSKICQVYRILVQPISFLMRIWLISALCCQGYMRLYFIGIIRLAIIWSKSQVPGHNTSPCRLVRSPWSDKKVSMVSPTDFRKIFFHDKLHLKSLHCKPLCTGSKCFIFFYNWFQFLDTSQMRSKKAKMYISRNIVWLFS